MQQTAIVVARLSNACNIILERLAMSRNTELKTANVEELFPHQGCQEYST